MWFKNCFQQLLRNDKKNNETEVLAKRNSYTKNKIMKFAKIKEKVPSNTEKIKDPEEKIHIYSLNFYA